jgi:hypothetical protein
MSEQQFQPIGDLSETSAQDVVIERRDPARWQGPLCDAIDRVIDGGGEVRLIENGQFVALIVPRSSVLSD